MFEVKFGTPKPVFFREYCKYGDQVMDVDLEARFAGKALSAEGQDRLTRRNDNSCLMS